MVKVTSVSKGNVAFTDGNKARTVKAHHRRQVVARFTASSRTPAACFGWTGFAR